MRTAQRRGLIAAVIAAAALSAAACGGGDSTVSATPSVSTPTDTAAATTTADDPAEEAEPAEDELPATAPPETVVELPADYPGPEVPQRSERDQRFLDALGDRGIEYSGDGDIALNAANLVCAAEQGHYDEMQMRAFVLAIVSSDAQILGHEIDGDQVTETYIATARENYC